MSTSRQDAVKAYIIELLNDGTLRGSRSPSTLAIKAAGEFSKDVLAAAGELFGQAAESGIVNIGAKVEVMARNAAERGLRAIVKELRASLSKK